MSTQLLPPPGCLPMQPPPPPEPFCTPRDMNCSGGDWRIQSDPLSNGLRASNGLCTPMKLFDGSLMVGPWNTRLLSWQVPRQGGGVVFPADSEVWEICRRIPRCPGRSVGCRIAGVASRAPLVVLLFVLATLKFEFVVCALQWSLMYSQLFVSIEILNHSQNDSSSVAC